MTEKKENKKIWITALIVIVGIVGIIFLMGSNSSTENYGKDSSSKNIQQAYEGYKESGEVDWELVYGDDWASYLKEELEEEGYRIIQISVSNLSSSDPLSIYFGDENVIGKKKIRVEMESLGERSEQIQSVVINSALMKNIYGFWIEILSPTNTCTYTIRWDDWISCLNDLAYNCNPDTFVIEDSLLSCK